MLWRAPGITPNTIVLLNEGALPYYADNSLIGALNWIYDPDNRSDAMDYALFYPTSRVGGTLPSSRARPTDRIRFHRGGLLRQHIASRSPSTFSPRAACGCSIRRSTPGTV